MQVFTIGHSTRTEDELADLLAAHRVQRVVDVRRFPGSRRHPHFARDELGRWLPQRGVRYAWLEPLGGRRRRRPDSPHTAWRVASFAAYADHMGAPEFAEAMSEVLGWARDERVALMCAEAQPERCHRRLIADWLVARGVDVWHIRDRRRVARHEMPAFARIDRRSGDPRVVYDAGRPDDL
jgi:uncharacterized protein (DUF488 family)